MNKTKKILSIILISLLIISTVFTLCKKIGLCASSSDSPLVFTGFPYIVGSDIARGDYFSMSFINSCVDDAINRYGSSSGFIYAYQNGNTSNGATLWVCFTPTTTISMPSDGTTLNTNIRFSKVYGYTLNGFSSEGSNSNIPFQPYRVFESLNGTKCYIRNTFIVNYPLYVKNPDLFLFSGTSTPVFGSSQGIDSPGFNPDFLDSYLDLVDDGQFNNSVGDLNGNTVQNPSNLEEWLELINGNMIAFFKRSIAGFKTINDNIVSGFNWLSDKIEEFNEKASERLEGFLTTTISGILSLFDDVKDNTDDIKDDIHGHYQWQQGYFTESGSSNTNFWEYFDEHLGDSIDGLFDNLWDKLPSIMKEPYRIAHWFYQHGLNNNEFDFMTLIHYLFDFDKNTAYTSFSNNKYGDFLLDVKDFSTNFITSLTGATESDRVFFTISLGEHFGVAIPDIVIDFDWYAQVKDTFLPWLMAFLYVSVVWLFIKRLPDIIRGVAGDISSFEDALPKDFTNASFNANTNTMTVTSGTRSRSGTSSSFLSYKVR